MRVGTDELIRTPNGWWPKRCVHHISRGQRVVHNSSGLYHIGSDSISVLPPCASLAAGRSSIGPLTASRHISEPQHSFPLVIDGSYGTASDLQYYNASYTVPEPPKRYADQVLFWWIKKKLQERRP